MNTAFERRWKVLFLDDDPAFLETMGKVMGKLAGDRWQIFTADNAGRALAVIQEQAVHLVVIDVQMPVVDGLQFLTLVNRRHPNLQKVVLTGFATEAYRAACLGSGAELFLEKPKNRSEQENLFATLNELLRYQPEEGFRGVLRRVGLQDVIQMECLGANSSVLEVTAGRRRGRIFIRDGAIVHAEANELQGEPAFYQLLASKGGEFALKPFTAPLAETIAGQWEFLLMEAARYRDEIGEREAMTPVDTSLPPELAELPDRPAIDEPEPGDPPEARGVPDTAWVAPDQVPASGRVIEEVLVCSSTAEVLHEWRVRNSDLWISFFEFLSQKSRRLGVGLPLGDFNRLEVGEGAQKLVVVLREDHGLLVRSRQVDDPPAAAES